MDEGGSYFVDLSKVNDIAKIFATRRNAYKKNNDKSVEKAVRSIVPIDVKFDTNKPTRDVISIDGSYATFFRDPQFPVCAMAVRTAFLKRHYDHEKVQIKIVWDDFADKFEIIDAEEGIKEDNDTVKMIDERINIENIETFIQNESIRAEEFHTLRLARENKGMIILYDGSIAGERAGTHGGQRADFTERVLDRCRENDNIIVGISKDSRMKSINGITRDEHILQAFTKSNPKFTGYHVVNEGFEKGVGTCFARLHEDAIKWFRIDYMHHEVVSIPEILRMVACYSQVNTLPGVPFPPLCAHDIAVKIRQLKSQMEDAFMKSLDEQGFDAEYIVSGLTNVGGKMVTGTFHDHLDNFTVVRKDRY